MVVYKMGGCVSCEHASLQNTPNNIPYPLLVIILSYCEISDVETIKTEHTIFDNTPYDCDRIDRIALKRKKEWLRPKYLCIVDSITASYVNTSRLELLTIIGIPYLADQNRHKLHPESGIIFPVLKCLTVAGTRLQGWHFPVLETADIETYDHNGIGGDMSMYSSVVNLTLRLRGDGSYVIPQIGMRIVKGLPNIIFTRLERLTLIRRRYDWSEPVKLPYMPVLKHLEVDAIDVDLGEFFNGVLECLELRMINKTLIIPPSIKRIILHIPYIEEMYMNLLSYDRKLYIVRDRKDEIDESIGRIEDILYRSEIYQRY